MNNNGFDKKQNYFIRKAINKISRKVLKSSLLPDIVSYKTYVDYISSLFLPSYKRYPCITPSWDNSSHRKGYNFFAFIKNTPQLYAKWLRHIVKSFRPYSRDENEWAEGNHLEPDRKWEKLFRRNKKILNPEEYIKR